MLRDQLVEGGEVARLLVVHVLHEWPQMGVGAHDRRRLRFVDEGCGQLAGLVDAEGAVQELALLLGQDVSGLP